MRNINSILAIIKREFKITYRNSSSILSLLLFFLLGIIIFVFSIGLEKEILNQIGIGIIWTLILLTNTLSISKFFQEDFFDNNIIIFHISGLSYEFISLIKILIIWTFIQIPFFIILPIAILLLNIDTQNLEIFFLTFIISSVIITCIAAISGSMNLLNNKNFTIGSLIIIILSIPVIIFSVGIIKSAEMLVWPQLNILLGMMFFFIAITPWICGICIKISLQNK
tara:strand:+ start:1960 stop:2634 length:675 start_codon:yes stop_codon:yes gene_type:complete